MFTLPSMSEMNRRVALCSSVDEVEGNLMVLEKIPRFLQWASITVMKPSSFGSSGSTGERNTAQTHMCRMRANVNLDITNAAWIYETRRISPGLWYKVLSYEESPQGDFWGIRLRLDSKSENSPSSGDMGLGRKSGVVL